MCTMKKLTVGFLALVLAFTATSCSTSETEMEIPKEALLKKAILKRNASGEYSVEYVVADQTVSDQIQVEENSLNEFHLSKVAYKTKKTHTEELVLDKNTLHISFVDYETDTKMKWSIEDENIRFAKGAQSEKFLKSYALTKSSGDELQLSFEVQDNVSAEYTFNEETNTYEVHLTEVTGSIEKTNFDMNLELLDTGVLKLDFVNHTGSEFESKLAGAAGDGAPYYSKPKRKPRIIMNLTE